MTTETFTQSDNVKGPRTVLMAPQKRLRDSFVTQGIVTESGERDEAETLVENVQIQGISFMSPVVMFPGDIRHIKVGQGQPRLASKIRVISCRIRSDSSFTITAEFF